ncbi:MAG: sugar phosphate isomerase [Bacteroidetes bacterium]|nr:sugar phosphate isomerase [Bacteroidota bacterium]
MKDNSAKYFVENESQFHLGDLVTEHSHPKTRKLSELTQESTCEGIGVLLDVDFDIIPVARKVIEGKEYSEFVQSLVNTIEQGGRVVFSSCGASGRLAIILESMWREFWIDLRARYSNIEADWACYQDQTLSIMTGGERAFIRSVENFEDFQLFGRQQVVEAELDDKDLLIALTEGGEISSVIGTMKEACERGCKVFMFYNNPRELLMNKFQRSKEVLSNPEIVSIELCTGPMALTGSTRMQATTIGMLLVGMAMEESFRQIVEGKSIAISKEIWPDSLDIRKQSLLEFEAILNELNQAKCLKGMCEWVDKEAEIYNKGGRVTYLAGEFLLDIISDTTERTPTFMIPPFCTFDDDKSPPPWAFACNPTLESNEAWKKMLGREPRGLDWTVDDYKRMGGTEEMFIKPPQLSQYDILKYHIGHEIINDESQDPNNHYLEISVDSRTGQHDIRTGPHDIQIGHHDSREGADSRICPSCIHIPVGLAFSAIKLFHHLALKIILNTVSTATMAKLGRIKGNWMIQVDATNKKLIDRATRIVQHFSGLKYEEACTELFKTMNDPEIDRSEFKISYVSQTLKRLGIS